MKIKVLKLLSDRNLGGVNKTMEGLMNSPLGEKFEFLTAPVSDSKSALKALKPELTIFHDPCSWRNLTALWAIAKQTRLIIHDHHYSQGFEQYQVPSKARFRLMLKLTYGTAHRVVAVSHAQGQWMRDYQLASPNKLSVIQQSPPIAKFLEVPFKPCDRPLTLGAYGRFSQQKGFDILIKAMRLVPSRQVQLILGGYGADEAMLKQLAEGMENVRFLGSISDVPAFLSTCDVVIIPSRWEPWGNVCLEAKAAGKPVIVTAVDGLVEQVQDCGIVVPAENPQALAKAIAQISNLPDETLANWGQNGREAVRSSSDDYFNAWESLLWEVLAK
ncbi:glycosyltransferase family 4 protein [Pseudanabaena sp. FACHB-1998]|uniref:glycosyltransferase family 4 protein n=1 Tax=Pseudanabaena sp. FACHB-1998 TaxID=2692858 RepID=UPI0016814FFA|nr:glycosyltransferase family 4 protein [Pseudanabaena sp. FACHB-1998]MBD2175768.1 glycosyltransferase family 4 protein [Pseudanabaena sp. FACHB-1998]